MRLLPLLVCSVEAALFSLPALAEPPRPASPPPSSPAKSSPPKTTPQSRALVSPSGQPSLAKAPVTTAPVATEIAAAPPSPTTRASSPSITSTTRSCQGLLVTAEGYAPLLTGESCKPRPTGPKVGPKALRLTPRDWSLYKTHQTLHGRVLESSGKPVAGAIVEAWGATNNDGSGSFGAVEGLDPSPSLPRTAHSGFATTAGAETSSVSPSKPPAWPAHAFTQRP